MRLTPARFARIDQLATAWIAPDGRVRLRGVRTLKYTLAAVAAYVIATPLSENPHPVLAPLTALLVVQLTLYDTLRSGVQRIVSVVAGVLIAVVLSEWVGLTWWSLGLAVAGSLLIGRVLRLRSELLEVPISAMLVLAVGGGEFAALGRVVETVVGAGVGVLVGAVVAPPLYVRPATDAVQDLARATAQVLRRVATEVREEYTAEQTEQWLDASRAVGREVLRADRELGRAEASMRLNPRARKRPHAAASLRTGLEALERSTISLRGLCRSLADLSRASGPETVYGEDVRTALSDLLSDVADAVETYGVVISAEVIHARPEDARLREALNRAWQDRHRLADQLRREERLRQDQWLMHGALASHIDRLLRDVDSDARAELRRSWPAPLGDAPRRPARFR